MDETKEALIKKYRSNIYFGGRYFILFGVWSVLRILMMFMMNREFAEQIFSGVDLSEIDESLVPIIYSLTFIISFVIAMVIHLTIGVGAIRYSRDKGHRRFFLFIAVCALAVSVLFVPMNLVEADKIDATVIASMMVDATMAYLLFDMVYSAFKLKNLIGEGRG